MDDRTYPKTIKKIKIYGLIMLAVFVVLFLRLTWMQIVEAEIYQRRAESNRTRLLPIPVARGSIISADGKELAWDETSYLVSVAYLGLADQDEVFALLSEILDDPEITPEKLEELLKEQRYRLYEPVVVKKGIDFETVNRLEENRHLLPGVSIEAYPERTTLPGIASHVIGYLGEVDRELGQEGYEDYVLGDLIGKIGVEKQYDTYLRGLQGYRQVEVDAKNRPIKELRKVEPEPGATVHLTLDYRLQKTMEDSFDRLLDALKKDSRSYKADGGAAVLLEVKTGRVLAMVNRPDDRVRVMNKAIQGRYIPGSTFKMVTALAGLETGKITPTETIYNPGRYWYAPYIKSVAPVGPMNLYRAISRSCNVYFQEVGRRAGIEAIGMIGAELGLDRPTGIDLPGENRGDSPFAGLPTAEKRAEYFEWAEKSLHNKYASRIEAIEKRYDDPAGYYGEQISALRVEITSGEKAPAEGEEEISALIAERDELLESSARERNLKKNREVNRLRAQWGIELNWNTTWHSADTFNIAIGQGRQNYTPLQLAKYMATVGSGGVHYRPYVVDRIESPDGQIIEQFVPERLEDANISERSFTEVQKALRDATRPGGTAYGLFGAFPEEYAVAAKTGTAQPGIAGYREGNRQFFDGIFLAYAPADDPEIAFAGIVEFGHTGSGSAGRIAKDVFEAYFGLGEKKDDNL